MKQKLTFLLMAIVMALNGWAQTTPDKLNEGFEDGIIPEGWNALCPDELYMFWFGASCSSPGKSAVHEGQYGLLCTFGGGIRTPILKPEQNDTLKFFVKVTDTTLISINITIGEVEEVGVTPTFFNEVSYTTTDLSTTEFIEYKVPMDNYVGKMIQINIEVACGFDGSGATAYIDDISGVALWQQTCFPVTDLEQIQATNSSVTVSWADTVSSQTVYDIQYLKGITTNASSFSNPEKTSIIYNVSASDREYTLEGLEPSAQYTIRVRARCSEEDSSQWSYPLGVYTKSNPVELSDLPFKPNNMYDWYPLRRVWRQSQYGGINYTPTATTQLTISGEKAYKEGYDYSTYDSVYYLVSSKINVDMKNIMLVFYSQKSAKKNTGILEVGVMTDINDTSSFIVVDTMTEDGIQMTRHEVDFSNVNINGPGHYIAFRLTGNNTSYKIATTEIREIQSCKGPEINSLQLLNRIKSNTSISWVDTVNTKWRVYYTDKTENTATEYEDTEDTVYYFTNLVAGHIYEVTVKSVCSSEISYDSAGVITFAAPTNHVINDFPYYIDFESADDIEQFDQYSAAPYTDKYLYVGEYSNSDIESSDEGTHSLYLSINNGADATFKNGIGRKEQTHLSFDVEFDTLSEYNLIFDYKIDPTSDGNVYQTLRVALFDSDDTLSTDQSVAAGTKKILRSFSGLFTDGWQRDTLHIFNSYIKDNPRQRLIFTFANSMLPVDFMQIDNIRIEETFCMAPPTVKAKAVGDDIEVVWDYTEAYSYDLYYSVDESAFNVIKNIDDTVFSFKDNGIEVTAVVPYRFYIVSNCGSDGMSIPSDTIEIWTPCQQGMSIPYVFNAADHQQYDIPDCWIHSSKLSGNLYPSVDDIIVLDDNGGYDTLPMLYFRNGNSGKCYAVLPPIPDSIDMSQLLFTAKVNEIGSAVIGVVENPNDLTTFDTLSTLKWSKQSPNEFDEVSILLSGYKGNGRYIAMQANIFHIDSIRIDYAPACYRPTTLRTESVSQTSATLSWARPNADVKNFKIVYNAYGQPEQEADVVIDGDEVYYTLTDLNPSTHYYWYVATDCGDGLLPSIIDSFTTECGPIALPYTLSETHVIGAQLKEFIKIPCWEVYYGKASGLYNYPVHNSNNSCIHFTSTDADKQILVSPEISDEIDMNNIKVTIVGTGTPQTLTDTAFLVGVMSSQDDSSSFETIGVTYTQSLAVGSTVSFAEYEGNKRYIAIRPLANSGSTNLKIESIIIDTLSNCVAPVNLMCVSRSNDSLWLQWHSLKKNMTDFVVNYKAVNSEDAIWQTTDAQLNADGLFALTGLEPSTKYEIYVNTNCSDEETLDTSRHIKAVTRGIATPLPYTTDFTSSDESLTTWELHDNGLNAWYIGTPSGATEPGLFLSENGTDTTYNQNEGYISAIKYLTMPDADSIRIDFDLMVYGYDDYDYLKVLFAPKGTFNYTSSLNVKEAPSTDDSVYALKYDYYYFSSLDNGKLQDGKYVATMNHNLHFTDVLANPNKDGETELMFIWVNEKTPENLKQSVIVRNLDIREVIPPVFTVTTDEPTAVADKSATLHASYDSDYELKSKGFLYRYANVSAYDTVEVDDEMFVVLLSNLVPETQYYVKAYITAQIFGKDSTVYGEEISFATLEEQFVIIPPTVSTFAPMNVTATTAVLSGSVTKGNEDVAEQGFEYGLLSDDTSDYVKLKVEGTMGSITYSLTNLQPDMYYIYRTYVSTTSGMYYGTSITFSTMDTVIVTDPVVTTGNALLESTNVVLNATVQKGSEMITESGFVYKLAENENWETVQVSITGEEMSVVLDNLLPESVYDYAAFVVTESGNTFKGETKQFTTNPSSLTDIDEMSTIILYPNPVEDKVTIEADGDVIITNTHGQIVKTLKNIKKSKDIDVSDLDSGVYYVTISVQNFTKTVKLIKK